MFGITAFAETMEQVQKITMTNAERYHEMLVTTIIGIATLFAILAFLWAFMILMKYIFNRPAKKKSKLEAVVSVQTADDNELIAVLSAAVAAILGTSNTKFRIKSFRRTK